MNQNQSDKHAAASQFKHLKASEMSEKIKVLFAQQLGSWELAKLNYENLKTVQTKAFSFGDFDVKVQFNPSRIVSSGAKVDAQSIAERKCFLCSENRPKEQEGIQMGDYTLLVNPFPIFPEHFTIVHQHHIPQQIAEYFPDLLSISELMQDYVVFYNGPQCGASAPDHLHFQAGTKNFLPLLSDYKKLKDTQGEVLVESESFQLVRLNHYLRTVYCIESISITSAVSAFEKLVNYFKTQPSSNLQSPLDEPMMNIVCSFEEEKWQCFILPRNNFRPTQYFAEAENQLLISPATVEMSGIFITPVQSHFDRITKEDILSIFTQSTTSY